MSRRELVNPTLAESYETMRSDYSAAKASRFRRHRTGISSLGSSADWHVRNEYDYLRIMEYARDMDRNDMVVGQIVDRAVGNVIQDGFVLDPNTGDKSLDTDQKDEWDDWSKDPKQCDLAGEKSFWDYENLSLRHSHVDGDFLVLPNQAGCLEGVEAHRLRTPKNTTMNVVCGVKKDPTTQKHQEYWFTRQPVNPMEGLNLVSDIKKYPAWDADGFKQVWQILVSQKRISQTRGMSSFTPIFDACGMFEDINFATMIRHQVAACFAVFEEMERGFDGEGGGTEIGTPAENSTQSNVASAVQMVLRGMGPGMFIQGKPGSKLHLDSPNVPSPEFFPHMKMILTLIGINLGLPLVMVLMDASETNFTGWRGAIEQARMGFRTIQRNLKKRLHRPCYIWRTRRRMAMDPTLRHAAERSGIDIFKHRWSTPTWPYIQPYQDAAADLLRIRNALISRRRQCAERGLDWDRLSTEITEDNAMMIEKAYQQADRLNKLYPDLGITWREIASLPSPDGVNVSLQPQNADTGYNEKTSGGNDQGTGK